MNYLLYIFELYLMFSPTAYYIPALETGNAAVLVFCIILNVVFMIGAQRTLKSIKAFFRPKTH